jgi:hypothetical protein
VIALAQTLRAAGVDARIVSNDVRVKTQRSIGRVSRRGIWHTLARPTNLPAQSKIRLLTAARTARCGELDPRVKDGRLWMVECGARWHTQ